MIRKRHYLAAIVAGVLLGLVVTYSLYAMAIPLYGYYLLPLSSYETLSELSAIVEAATWREKQLAILVTIGILPFVLSIVSTINPQLRFAFSRRKLPGFADLLVTKKLQALLALLAGAAMLVYLLFVVGEAGINNKLRSWVIVLLGGAFAWCLLSPSAWGNFSEAGGRGTIKSWIATALHGAGFMGAFYGLAIFFLYLFQAYAFPVIVEVYSPFFDAIWSVFKTNTMILVLMDVPIVMLSLGVLPFFTAIDKPLLSRIAQARTGLVTLAATGLAIAIAIPLTVARYDLGKGPLAEAAWLKDIKPEKYTLLRLCAEASCDQTAKGAETQPGSSVYAQAISESEDVYRYGVSGSVPVNRAALEPLRKFALDTSSHSAKRKLVVEGLLAIHDRLLQPDAYIAEIENLQKAGAIPSVITAEWGMNHIQWLATAAPVSHENYEKLRDLSDDARYFHGRFAATYLAHAWARFDESHQAGRFKYMTKDDELKKRDPDQDGKLTFPTFSRGQITGKVVSSSIPLDKLRVVLVSAKNKKGKTLINSPEHMYQVVANTPVQRDGAFHFEKLVNGGYGLALLADDTTLATASEITIKNVTGLIRIDRKNPHAMLTDIKINTNTKLH